MGELQVLEERTANLIRKVDEHAEEDRMQFNEVFKRVREIELSAARAGVVIGAVVIMAQIVVGAWVKGLF